MLIRIAPDMFIDARFDCVTIDEVKREIFEKQKFKSRYPWRLQFRDKIVTITPFLRDDPRYNHRIQLVEKLVFQGTLNRITNRFFDLSYQDRQVASAVITLDCRLSSTDADLVQFLVQQFDKENRYPLEIVNDWLRAKLLSWHDELQAIIEDWVACNEPSQPLAAIEEFEQLTGYKYPGE
jgi:hypothetical protein